MTTGHGYRQRLGNYELLSELDQGGMARLYIGRHLFDGRQAAIKILHKRIAKKSSSRTRLINEARAIASICDPCVVKLYDCGVTHDGNIFLAMEYIEGETLGERLKIHGELPVLQAMAIAKQLAGALSAVHAVGITHRDLKPRNVMLLDEDGTTQAKLLDFGIAKFLSQGGSERSVTRPGTIIGTPSYMAPEQCAGSGDIDHRADVYSLGVLLYRMLAGRLPFTGEDPVEIIEKHLRAPPMSLRLFRREVSKRLESIVMQCLAKKPEDRFQNASDLIEALGWEMYWWAKRGEKSETSMQAAPVMAVGSPTLSKRAELTGDRKWLIPTDRVAALAETLPAIPSRVTSSPPPLPKKLIAKRPAAARGTPSQGSRVPPISDSLGDHGDALGSVLPRVTHGALKSARTMPTLMLHHKSARSVATRAGRAAWSLSMVAWPLISLMLVAGFIQSAWNQSMPALVYRLQEIGAITCIDCRGHQPSPRDETAPGTLQPSGDGTSTPVHRVVIEVHEVTPDATSGDSDGEPTGNDDVGNSDATTETATNVAHAANRASPPTDDADGSSMDRDDYQRAESTAEQSARPVLRKRTDRLFF